MFSTRLPPSIAPTRLAARLDALRARGTPPLDLTTSNPTHAGFAHPPDLLTLLADPRSLQYEPEPRGLPTARDAVCAYYADAHGASVDPRDVLLTASSSEAYSLLFKLLCDPGDRILAPTPSYPLFELLAGLESVALDGYALGYDGAWHLDLSALERACTPRTRAVVVVHPNNPTGSFLKRDELDALVAFCAARSLAIVSDEVFADYAFEADPRRARTLANEDRVLCFALSGLSKVCALPQLKLGWIVASGPDEMRRAANARLELIADTFLSVAAPVQNAAPALLAARAGMQQRIRARTRDNLHHLHTSLAHHGRVAHALHVEGGWYATLRIPAVDTEEQQVLTLLEQDHVLVQPGYFFDFAREAYLVVSLLTPTDVFREGIDRLLARVQHIA